MKREQGCNWLTWERPWLARRSGRPCAAAPVKITMFLWPTLGGGREEVGSGEMGGGRGRRRKR